MTSTAIPAADTGLPREISKPAPSLLDVMDEFNRLRRLIDFAHVTVSPASDFDHAAFSEYAWTLSERATAFARGLEGYAAATGKAQEA